MKIWLFLLLTLGTASAYPPEQISMDKSEYEAPEQPANQDIEEQDNNTDKDGEKYVFCHYCGKLCTDNAARRAHEAVCPKKDNAN